MVPTSPPGGPGALDDLFARHPERLRRMVRIRLDARLNGRIDASDVVQEADLQASRRLEEYLRDPVRLRPERRGDRDLRGSDGGLLPVEVRFRPDGLDFDPTGSTTPLVTASASTTDPVTTGTPSGTFATSGTQFLHASGGASNGLSVSLSFGSNPIAGIGLYCTDLSDSGTVLDQLKIAVTFTDGTSTSADTSKWVTSELPHSSLVFFGAISFSPSELIKSVVITDTDPTANADDAVGIDDVTIGQATVPEPSSVVMVALGVGAVVVARRLRRREGGTTS